jgi:transposase InsO family protein
VVIDLFSRQVVGWSLREDMTSNLVIDALRMAWFKRHPGKQAGLLFHSDQGSQYASGAFRDVLKEYGILSSMSRRGNCWDTQSKINSSTAFDLTRAGIGAMPRMKPSRGCSGTTKSGCIRRWLTSVRCSSSKPGFMRGKPVHDLGYGIRNPGARSFVHQTA